MKPPPSCPCRRRMQRNIVTCRSNTASSQCTNQRLAGAFRFHQQIEDMAVMQTTFRHLRQRHYIRRSNKADFIQIALPQLPAPQIHLLCPGQLRQQTSSLHLTGYKASAQILPAVTAYQATQKRRAISTLVPHYFRTVNEADIVDE